MTGDEAYFIFNLGKRVNWDLKKMIITKQVSTGFRGCLHFL